MGMIIDFKTKGKIEPKADPKPAPPPIEGTAALAQPIQARYQQRITHKESLLKTHLKWLEEVAMRGCSDWDEAIEMERRHLTEQSAEWIAELGDPKRDESAKERIGTNQALIADLDKAEAIYNAEMESVRPLIAAAHERFAARVEQELRLGDLAEAVRDGDPLSWLDWN